MIQLYESNNTGISTASSSTFNGNVSQVSDIYSSNPAGNDSAGAYYDIVAISRATRIDHVNVRSSTAGKNNWIEITAPGLTPGGIISQWTIEVRETTKNLFTSRTRPAPTLISLEDGQVVTI